MANDQDKRKSKNKKKNRWRRVRHGVVKALVLPLSPLVKLWYGAKVDRMKKPGKRPYLLLSNHQTAFDQFFVGMVYRKPVYYVASEDLFSNGFISRMLEWAVRPIPIRKQTTDVRAVMTCVKVAKEGGTIAITPEGNRTYSGRTMYINPAIGGLVKLLRLPVAFIRSEGGYGVQPRWANNVRKGKMHVYVSRIMEPEEYKNLSDEQIADIVKKELYVNDFDCGGTYKSKARAEFMDRFLHVCPDCGLATFHAEGQTITCTKCRKTWTYLEDRTFDKGPFKNPLEWYDYQERYINSLDLLNMEDELLFCDRASMKEVILYKNKQLIAADAELKLYGGKLEVTFGGKTLCYPFREVTAFTVLGRNKLNLYIGDKVFQFKGDKHFDPVKYMNLHHRFQNLLKGDEYGKFLGF